MDFSLNTHFLHLKLLMSIMDTPAAARLKLILLSISALNNSSNNLILDREFTREALNFIREKKINPLNELILKGTLKPGELVTFERTFTFRGINQAVSDRKKGKLTYAKFHLKMPEHDNLIIKGTFNPEHLTCDSAQGKLSGKSRVFIFAHITEVTKEFLELKPIIIADKVLAGPESLFSSPSLRIMAEEIDEFKKALPYTVKMNIDELKKYSEEQIKTWFAEIINEENVPKDWGGEYSDLYTTHIHLRGKRLHAAFTFKGPSKFHPMKMNDLGKNGDQIVRLFQEPANILILQHCHYISAAVSHTMEAFASRMYMPRYYCLLDGIDTLRILRGYKKILFV